VLERLGRTPREIERELNTHPLRGRGNRQAGEQKKEEAWRELLRPGLRTALVVGVGLAIFQQLIGVNAVIYYTPIIFQDAGVSSANTAILQRALLEW
jgi:hypothetical protein